MSMVPHSLPAEGTSNEPLVRVASARQSGRVRPQRLAENGGRHNSVLAEHLQFFGAFLRKPNDVGAVLPSSPALARALLHGCQLKRAKVVVELGPGTGAVTKLIVEHMGRRTALLALELDEAHTHGLRRRFPGIAAYNDSAENIRVYLHRHGFQSADYIISGLPWTNMNAKIQQRIMQEVLASLAPGGLFTTFGYIHSALLPAGRRFREWLLQNFAHVEISRVVWRNVPPAFVYRCRQAAPR